MPLERLHDPVIMNGPIKNGMAFLGGHKYGKVIMRVGDQLDLMIFHVEFPEQLAIDCVVGE